MDPTALIPSPDTIPAPAWLFLVLDIVTFILHILLINVVVGGCLLMLFSRRREPDPAMLNTSRDILARKLPSAIALGITFGVAPLLFVQVIYGPFIYSSSVLMAVYWILVIPFLILAYYGLYLHARRQAVAPILARTALAVASVLLLAIGFIYVNNMTLMIQPEKWTAYFSARGGTLLNLNDATLLPRYLHFVVASVAVAALFMALVWWYRGRYRDIEAVGHIRSSLKIFGVATAVQMVTGFWLLMALPSDFILSFMGRNLFYTLTLFFAILMAVGALISAFLGRLAPTLIHLLLAVVAMALTRANLRMLYLQDVFNPDSLVLKPQYGVMILFFVVFLVGLVVVGGMARMIHRIQAKGGAR